MDTLPSYERIWAWPNLLLAWEKARRGKRSQASVAGFEHRLEEHLLEIQSELRDQTWQPAPYTSFFIHEPKRRLISAAPFRDRVVHHALCNISAPILERSFVPESFANRTGFGTHRALDACQGYARRFRYFLAMDVRQFFPSIDHGILKEQLRRQVHDAGIVGLMDRILSGGAGVLADEYEMVWYPGDDLMARFRPRGLPIGNLTSQLWANVHLTPFDHFVKRELRCRGYVRYVDDFRLFADDKRALWEWRDAIIERLAEFRLAVHPRAQPRQVREGIPFLGFRIWPGHRRLKPRKVNHAGRKLLALARDCSTGKCTLAKLHASLRAWISHASNANTVGLRKSMLRKISIRPAGVRPNPDPSARSKANP